MIDLSTKKHIHIVGIGGVSNSAIAEILLTQGHLVSGSDLHHSDLTDHLMQMGLVIHYSHSEDNVSGADLVVYTSAVSDNNPEILAAATLGIPCISRAEMLGHIMSGYKDSIAISGTHGKTTTTSMVTRIFNDAKHDPTALVGGYFADIKSNVRLGKSQLFITERSEERRVWKECRSRWWALD